MQNILHLYFFRNLNFPKIQEVLTPPRDQILNEKVKTKVKKVKQFFKKKFKKSKTSIGAAKK